jgi:hypothetical protein
MKREAGMHFRDIQNRFLAQITMQRSRAIGENQASIIANREIDPRRVMMLPLYGKHPDIPSQHIISFKLHLKYPV